MRLRILPALLCVSLFGSCRELAPPPDDFVPVWPHGTMVQGMVGLAELDENPVDHVIAVWDGREKNSTTVPLLMVAVQHPLGGAHLQPGFEFGCTLVRDHDSFYADLGGTGTPVRTESDLWGGDLFVGGSLSLWLKSGARLYAGAGPLFTYGFVELDQDDDVDEPILEDEAGFGYGAYTRFGFEVPLWDNTWIGLQVRWVDAELDFGGAVGRTSFDSRELVLSMSQGI